MYVAGMALAQVETSPETNREGKKRREPMGLGMAMGRQGMNWDVLGMAQSGPWASALSALSSLSALWEGPAKSLQKIFRCRSFRSSEVVTALLACEDGGVASSESLLVTWPKDSQDPEIYNG